MQVDLDFDVFKTLTLMRKSEDDTVSEVIRRLLDAPREEGRSGGKRTLFRPFGKRKSDFAQILSEVGNEALDSGNEPEPTGIWLANSYFPDGTKLRATYKGQTYFARIENSQWVGDDGQVRTSASDAARAVTGNNVNGWRFWHALLPGEEEWHRMDHYKKR